MHALDGDDACLGRCMPSTVDACLGHELHPTGAAGHASEQEAKAQAGLLRWEPAAAGGLAGAGSAAAGGLLGSRGGSWVAGDVTEGFRQRQQQQRLQPRLHCPDLAATARTATATAATAATATATATAATARTDSYH